MKQSKGGNVETVESRVRHELQEAPDFQSRNRYWQPWEDEILKEFWSKRNPQLIAEKLNRTLYAIQLRAQALGLTRKGRPYE